MEREMKEDRERLYRGVDGEKERVTKGETTEREKEIERERDRKRKR